jgi:hypothetical protein
MDSDSDNEAVSWDFRAVRHFLRAFDLDFQNPPASPSIPDHTLYDPKSSIPKSLGDFDRCLSFCGKPLGINPPRGHRKFTDSSSARSNESTPASSAPDDDILDGVEHFDDYNGKVTGKEVRWKDQLGRDLTEVRRRSTYDFDAAVIARLVEDDGYESDSEPSSRLRDRFVHPPAFSPQEISVPFPIFNHRSRAVHSFLPSSVTPPKRSFLVRPPPPIPTTYVDSSIIQPFYTLTANEQKAKLVKKLLKKFPGESDIVNSISRLGNKLDDGIHIFVDCSNIVIGFYNRLKWNRKISTAAYVKQPPISYHSLALVLERGRRVSRRILVGSNPRPYASERGLPDYMQEAAMLGYEVNMLERVQKLKRQTSRKKKHGTGNGYATTSGQSSGSETPFSGISVVAEQAVDELLQMKLLESMYNDPRPLRCFQRLNIWPFFGSLDYSLSKCILAFKTIRAFECPTSCRTSK